MYDVAFIEERDCVCVCSPKGRGGCVRPYRRYGEGRKEGYTRVEPVLLVAETSIVKWAHKGWREARGAGLAPCQFCLLVPALVPTLTLAILASPSLPNAQPPLHPSF